MENNSPTSEETAINPDQHAPIIPKPVNWIKLVQCGINDPQYKYYRKRHYVPIHGKGGCYGRQIHYLIYLDDKLIGIISGASAAMAVKERDIFFKLPTHRENKKLRRDRLQRIIDNVIFRIELDKSIPNLASRIVAIWRKQITIDWEKKYSRCRGKGGKCGKYLGVYGGICPVCKKDNPPCKVLGFETFVDGDDDRTGRGRAGTCYKADNWTFSGITQGASKNHVSGMYSKILRKETSKKLLFCRLA